MPVWAKYSCYYSSCSRCISVRFSSSSAEGLMSGLGMTYLLGKECGLGTSMYSMSRLFISLICSGSKSFRLNALASAAPSSSFSVYSNGRFFLEADSF